MRFIDLAYKRPPAGFDEAVAKAKADGEDKIKDHGEVWALCKPVLKEASHNKCFYCEMKQSRSDGAVDHYRPKSKYKWAAYRFDNFRFACTFCNSRRTDPKTGEVAGKGKDFPLFEGCERATCQDEVDQEDPVLLDPCDAADPGAIDFLSDGRAVPRSKEEADPDRRRALDSIEAYHLNHSDLEEARRCVSIEIQEKVSEAEKYLKRHVQGDMNAKKIYSAAVRDLKRRLTPDTELCTFSKRILQTYKSKPFVEDILATA
ncbi:uncharacterized protein (TIGR02646 family) [Thalassospira sp. MBR-102]|jgi:uncharacterized protein (TIGR02646 family)|uniref:hypothetical protein n=1 Tax=Thalassospira sp. MBR-102 TaxID=3156466 RepID=UPI003393A132